MLPDQEGPSDGTCNELEMFSTRELAYYITLIDWDLFCSVHEVTWPSSLVACWLTLIDWLPPLDIQFYSILFIEIPVWHLILVWAAVSRRRSATVPQNQVQPGSVFASLQWNSILGRHRDLLGQYAGKESPTLAQVHQISRLVRKDLRHPQSIVSIVLNFCLFFLSTVAKSSRI